MSDHDPMCGMPDMVKRGDDPGCLCGLIDKVRANEQERHGNNCGGMWDERVTDLRAKVEALDYEMLGRSEYVRKDDVLALLSEDEAEPPSDVDVWNRTFGSASVIRCQYCGDVRSSVTDRARHEASQHGAVRSDGSSE